MDTTQARDEMLALMAKHLDSTWKFEWCNDLTTLGWCFSQTKTLKLSYPLTEVNDHDEILDTMLHEIAHALAGPGAKHGATWKRIAMRLGAHPRAAGSRSAKMVVTQYQGTCPSGHVTYAVRRPSVKRLNTSCGQCSSRFNPAYKRRWVDTVTGQVMRDFDGAVYVPLRKSDVLLPLPMPVAARKISPPSAPRKPRVRTAPEVGYTDIESLFAGD